MALRSILNGCERDKATGRFLPSDFRVKKRAYELKPEPTLKLSDRQKSVLLLAARGKSVGASGYALGITFNTIKNHRTNIIKQLGATCITNAVYIAMNLGLIS